MRIYPNLDGFVAEINKLGNVLQKNETNENNIFCNISDSN